MMPDNIGFVHSWGLLLHTTHYTLHQNDHAHTQHSPFALVNKKVNDGETKSTGNTFSHAFIYCSHIHLLFAHSFIVRTFIYSFHPLPQTPTLFCTMKLSSIALGTVAAVAMLSGADANCGYHTFKALVAKAGYRGISLPRRSCMEQVFGRSCIECKDSFICYTQ